MKTVKKNDIKILPTRNGLFTADFNGILLHSRFDPLKEAQRFVQGCKLERGDCVFLYGFGLGYHVKEIARKIGGNGCLIVLELNADLFQSAMSVCDIEEISSLCNFDIVMSPDKIVETLNIISQREMGQNRNWKTVIHPTSFKCIPKKHKKIARLFEMRLLEDRTRHKFKSLYLENFRKNISKTISSPGLNCFVKKFRDLPAVIVGAGPSLDDYLDYLKDIQDKIFIVAVDTSAKVLIREGIKPDFIVTVDPQERTCRHFDGIWDCGVPLLFTPVSAGEVIEKYKGPLIVFLQKDHSVTGGFENLLGTKGFSLSGGSVSCIAFDIMVQLGYNPIVMAGMDYSYPNFKAYCANSFESEQLRQFTHRYYTLEMAHRKRIEAEKIVKVRSYSGREVLSGLSLCSYKKNIEKLVAHNRQKVSFYNLADCGVLIEGTSYIRKESLLGNLTVSIDKQADAAQNVQDENLEQQIIFKLNKMK
ncbi:DUF115 domain-containing protein, partial [bacterium]|nr:DUF115 domain-containing protein [bacterium]